MLFFCHFNYTGSDLLFPAICGSGVGNSSSLSGDKAPFCHVAGEDTWTLLGATLSLEHRAMLLSSFHSLKKCSCHFSVLICQWRDTSPWSALVHWHQTTTFNTGSFLFLEETLLAHTLHQSDVLDSYEFSKKKGSIFPFIPEKNQEVIHTHILHSSLDQPERTGGSDGIFLSGSLVLHKF